MGKESALRLAYDQVCGSVDRVSSVGPKELRDATLRTAFLATMQEKLCEDDDVTRIQMLLSSLEEALEEVLGVTINNFGGICPSRKVWERIQQQGCASAFLKHWNVQAKPAGREQDVFPNAYSQHTATAVEMRERYDKATAGVFRGIEAISLVDEEQRQIRQSLELLHLMQIMKEQQKLFDLYFQ